MLFFQQAMYDGRREENFEPVHGPNRIQASLEFPSITLGAKTDPPNLGFHIQIQPASCKLLLKLHGGLNLGKTLFTFQLCRSSGFLYLTDTLTNASVIALVYQKSPSHCFSPWSSWDMAETHNFSLLLCNCQHQYTLDKTS